MRELKKVILLIFGILSILYGIFVLQVGSGTRFWMIWEAIGIFFFFWTFLVYTDFFTAHRKIQVLFHTMVGVGSAVIVLLCGMIMRDFSAEGKENLDCIIVLGAQVRENGPSVVLKYRLDTAIAYLNENRDTVCIVSGGKGANEPFSEAEGMAEYLLEKGIEEDRIILEDRSRNTAENIQNSRELIMGETYQGVGIVTNNFHVFRAVEIAKAQGLENVCGIAADSNVLYLPNNVLRECCGILKDWIMKNMSEKM